MMCLFHTWSRWEDVKLGEQPQPTISPLPMIILRQVITQQRRCSACNLVKTRYSS